MAAVLISATIKEDDTSEIITVNKDITRTTGFSVHSDSTDLNTSARGTIFVGGTGEIPENIRIFARIEVDPDDWGGVAFYIPAGWYVSAIMSSYPENDAPAIPADHVTTWTAAEPESEWSARVEVGRDRGNLTAGRGTGTVVIDLLPDKDAIGQTGTLDIMVAVGSDEKNGVKICGTDYIEIPVS
ncbi:hypothetical protein E2N92_03870 [Methanofollis formosanus]|uniref:Uncharacterized protein n=1 Tax=Methanofollis formosanus TaxID=299308 RepID=A0A8G1A062_9EURY|nr:hypothetical protein [Methanofollis formosanus]QYZ78620.1 hypothetical protein E2N92_03870 [Methanofollis formosanus]